MARIIVVTSGKGGVGKTTTSASFASGLALRGRALAGAKGDTSARIYTTCMQAQLLSVAGVYRTGEAAVPAALDGQAAQVRLDGDSLVVEGLSR